MSLGNMLLDKLKELSASANSKGIPLPMIRDPKTGLGSVSLTLVFLSFNVVLIGLIGKISKFLGEIDLTQALWLFGICTSLYFGRRVSGDGKGKIEITDKADEGGK
jgi:hypothetical protein